MSLLDWLRPGLKFKRWILLGVAGILLLSYGIAFFIMNGINQNILTSLGFYSIILGMAFLIMSAALIIRTLINALNDSGLRSHLDSKRLRSILIERKYLEKGPKLVAIGGGTGLSTMLRGLKSFTANITAVVTVSDDGGGSGVLRQDLGMLPPGDIRNCILALARTEPILEKLLQYRFEEGRLNGQNFGNLFLAAMTRVCGSFDEAVKKMSDVLAVTGHVLPVTIDDIRLCAELEDKSLVFGECNIVSESKSRNKRINRVFIEPSNAHALPEVISTIKDADVIILGPGSLYTSVIPNLLVKGVSEAIRESNALKVYVCNIMTQKGETDNYSVYDHIRAIEDHVGLGYIDYCIVNKGRIKDILIHKYNLDGAQRVNVDEYKLLRRKINLVKSDLLGVEKGFLRHDPQKLALTILKLINEEINLKEKKKVIEYLYIKDKIKKIASS